MQVVWHSWTQTHTMVTLKKKGKIHLNRNTTIQLVQRGAKKRKPNWEEICFQTADKSGLTGSSGCEGAPEYEQRHRLQLIKAGRWICVVLCVPSLLSNVVKRMGWCLGSGQYALILVAGILGCDIWLPFDEHSLLGDCPKKCKMTTLAKSGEVLEQLRDPQLVWKFQQTFGVRKVGDRIYGICKLGQYL